MIRLFKRQLSAALGFMLMVSLISPLLTQSVRADGEEPFVMPDTTVYKFGATSGNTVSLVGDPSAAPVVTTTSTGVKIQSSLMQSRTFEFDVNTSGTYRVMLGGMTEKDGGTADVSIDGTLYGQYSFYSVNGQYPRPDLYLKQLPLEAGRHTITLTAKAKGNANGNGTGTTMYPSRLVLTDLAAAANSKTRRTYYTDEKVQAARQNVQLYDWAAAQRDDAVAKAARYLSLSFDDLWNSVPTQYVPRSYNVNQLKGNFSPISGDLKSYGNYPWKADPVNEPWKIVDPASGYKFPTNDFAAYYRSGLDEHGNFIPSRADRSLLVNTLYPEKGPTWGVDDGYGWVDPATNTRYTFVAYYAHWFSWTSGSGNIANVQGALDQLQKAYVFTGDEKYAKAGAILLDRVADVYPALDTAEFSASIYVNSHGGTGDGKAVGSIWETGLVKTFVSAYDAFFTAFDDPEVVAFLKAKGEQYDLPLKQNGSQIRRNIEDGILRQIQPGMYWDQIRGNNGFHQSALAMTAVVHDTMPETKQWLDFTFQSGGYVGSIPRRVTGGNVLFSMVNDVDRDGNGNEAAPGYNRQWLSTFLQVADMLQGYDKYPIADLYQNVKFRKMFQAIYPLIMVGKYTPSIGDSGATGSRGISVDKAQTIRAFEKFGDPIYAQLAYMLNGNKTDDIHSDVYTSDPTKIAREIEAVVQQYGPLDLGSTHLTGYGFAGLRDGQVTEEADNRRGMWLYYGRNGGHGHRDKLNIDLYAFGLDLAPDLGYPESANAVDPHRHEWMLNTISHNTVVVDKQKQKITYDATPLHYDDNSMVKLIDVNADGVYPQTEMYRRTSAMIHVDDANSYTVDFFRVKGGSEHHFSFHGAEGPVSTEGLTLTPQPTGTYAGPDVPFGVRPADDSVAGSGYTGPGFHWLNNVERDSAPSDKFSVDYDIADTWNYYPVDPDVHLRLTMLGQVDDVALADGVPPRNNAGNPDQLRYVIAHRSGENLSSTFTSVIEPYKDQRFVTDISEAAVTAEDGTVTSSVYDVKAVKVSLANGRTDYVISSLNPDTAYIIDGKIRFQGSFGVYSEKDDQPSYTYVNDGAYIGKIGTPYASAGVARLQGTIVDFTKDLTLNNKLVVQMNTQGVDPASLVGTSIYVQNDGARNATYQIKGVQALGNDQYELDLGDITLIRSYKDPTNLFNGFVYDVAEGSAFAIPLDRQQMWLSDVKIAAAKTELNKNETVQLEVQGYYPDGTRVDLAGYNFKYDINTENVANVNGTDLLKAHTSGTSVVSTTVEVNGVHRTGVLQVTVK